MNNFNEFIVGAVYVGIIVITTYFTLEILNNVLGVGV